ncbi:MAG TPA: alpha amylase C-terminal domain-containing protein, partial [Candidatus Limnocylindria bacterium]|nr:alpha amylase C-terminal domain-containing protein [Candidatus Limnocylindria bacterium]
IDAGDSSQSILSYLRRGEMNEAPVAVICNFTPVARQGFRLGVPKRGRWIERLNTDSAAYGGSNVGNLGGIEAQETSRHGQPFSLELTIPPLATLVLEHAGDL